MLRKSGSAAASLTDLQLSLLRVLWDHGESSAAEVQRALQKSRPMAITTVATLLARLEKRGLVSHTVDGRTFVYRPSVSERDVRHRMLSGLVQSLFRGDPRELVHHLITEQDVSAGDAKRIQEMIAESKSGSKTSREARKHGR